LGEKGGKRGLNTGNVTVAKLYADEVIATQRRSYENMKPVSCLFFLTY